MFTLADVVQPETLQEAYALLTSSRNNVLLGGCAYLRLGTQKIGTGIDLSRLELDYIKENEGFIEIGAMSTFRDLETHPLLTNNFSGMLPKSLSNIIGVQFRNLVTVGATVFTKYGFSDLLTALLSLDTEVELYQGGRMPLEQFLDKPFERDILTRIFIKLDGRRASYQCLRNSTSDYPILNVAVAKHDGSWVIAVGARPQRAKIARGASDLLSRGALNDSDINNAAQMAVDELSFGSNMRGTEEYRRAICKVLVKRAIAEVQQCK